MSLTSADLHLVRSCDLHHPVRVKICTLEGQETFLIKTSFPSLVRAIVSYSPDLPGSSLSRPTHSDLLSDPGLRFCGRNQSVSPDLSVTALVASAGRRRHVPVTTAYRYSTTFVCILARGIVLLRV